MSLSNALSKYIYIDIKEYLTKFESNTHDRPSFISLKKTFKFQNSRFFPSHVKSIFINWKKKWKGKSYFHAIDDILYLLKEYPDEQELTLQLFNSIGIYFQNNLLINLLDIIIDDINFNRVKINNRFFNSSLVHLENDESITFTIICLLRPL